MPLPEIFSFRSVQNPQPTSHKALLQKVSVGPKRVRNPSQNVSNPNGGGKRRTLDFDSETNTESESGSEMEMDSDSDSDSDNEVKVRIEIPDSGSPPRRSSRLRDVPPVSYVETTPQKVKEPSENVEGESTRDDDDDDEDGGDGMGRDDGVEDETCHQCRQRTLGDLTHCSRCDLVQGQFCGDCLVMKYGENVIKANQNPEWVCPVCRGICNCSHCSSRKELMHDDTKEEMEGALMGKEVNLGSEFVSAEDVGKLDAATTACDVDGDTKKEPKRSTMTGSAHVAEQHVGKLDAAGDGVRQRSNQEGAQG